MCFHASSGENGASQGRIEGTRAWDGHGQLFSASGIADTTRAPANIDARDGAAFHLTTLMVEWPELGRNFGGGSKNQR